MLCNVKSFTTHFILLNVIYKIPEKFFRKTNSCVHKYHTIFTRLLYI